MDRMKKSVPDKYKKRPETSLATALVSATLATLMCYPLDTMRRQMQMKGSPYKTVIDAFPGTHYALISAPKSKLLIKSFFFIHLKSEKTCSCKTGPFLNFCSVLNDCCKDLIDH